MNLTISIFILIICTIIIDFFSFKRDKDIILKTGVKKRIIDELFVDCLTYMIFTLIFSLIFKYALVSSEYFTCNNKCHILVSNGFVGLILLILQVLNIYNFYDSYVHSFRIFSEYQDMFNKIFVFFLGVFTILFNEFILSNIDLSILYFKYSFINIFLVLVNYSLFIFLPLVILFKELRNRYIFRKREEKEFEN